VCDTHAPYEEPEGKVEGKDAPEDKLHAFDVQEHFFLRFFSTVLENHHQTIFILNQEGLHLNRVGRHRLNGAYQGCSP
jgi:hypothetical protein